ncbi:MAG: endonuclease/exonuclease/phosphatase family protein [Candidatus Lokiarchaeota archaeon]|nr:endonuclease/exonuclease/phosphatase family protein [Candidatus Lokiarchaeota archaeon]
MKVMSFNARTSSIPDKKHDWPKRRQLVIDIVKKYQPDVVGFQEVQRDQLADLLAGLPGYRCHHQGWQDVDVKQELLPAFYSEERVTVRESGAFWLNETPGVPRIGASGGQVLRACTWIRASCPSDAGSGAAAERTYAIFNTHFDHQKEARREEGARVVLERVAALSSGAPAILIGDLNAGPGSTTYGILRGRFVDAFVDSPTPRGDRDITCHCFTGATKKSLLRPALQWIDHILMDNNVTCKGAYRILDVGGRGDGTYPSDHWPVAAELA